MAGNSFGNIFRLTSFGESHGNLIGGVIEGCPPDVVLNIDDIIFQLSRRRPSSASFSSQRKELEIPEFVSGLFEGKTLGTPLTFFIRNNEHKPEDYDALKNIFRPSHADYTTYAKYGIRDHRGGGRSSARETAVRVVAGSVASQLLRIMGIEITAFVSQIGDIILDKPYKNLNLQSIDDSPVRCPDPDITAKMIDFLDQLAKSGDTCGGIITCIVKNVPAGIGEPVFDKLHAELGKAILSINSVKGFDYGSGFLLASARGSQVNDEFIVKNGSVSTKTNFSGGIQGGISNGQDIYFRAVFKPVPSVKTLQETIDSDLQSVKLKISGRHDTCVLPRAVPVVESMAAITILDFVMFNNACRINNYGS